MEEIIKYTTLFALTTMALIALYVMIKETFFDKKNKINPLIEENAKLQNERIELTKEVVEFKKENADLQKVKSDLSECVEMKIKGITRLQYKVNSLEAENAKLKKENDKLDKENFNLLLLASKIKKDNQIITKWIKSKDLYLSLHAKKINALEQYKSTITESNKAMSDEINRLKALERTLRNKLNASETNNEGLRNIHAQHVHLTVVFKQKKFRHKKASN